MKLCCFASGHRAPGGFVPLEARPLLGVPLFMLVIVLVWGCRPAAKDRVPVADPDPPPTAQGVPGYRVEELSAIGGYLPTLDDARLRVAPPIDWYLAPRSRGYVARFVFDRTGETPLPRITIMARDAEADEPGKLDEENVCGYAKSLARGMDEKLRRTLEAQVEPILLGGLACVRYVHSRAFRHRGRLLRASCEVVQTIVNDRVYTVSLDANVGTLFDYRADVYAVVATMQFPQTAEPSNARTPEELPPDRREAGSKTPADQPD